MNNLITYLFELNICFTCLFVLYLLVFRNLSFFKFNRAYLLISALISILIPFLDFGLGLASLEVVTIQLDTINVGIQAVEKSVGNYFNLSLLLTVVYLLGCAFVFVKFLRGLWKIHQLKENSVSEKREEYNLIYSSRVHLVASFFNNVFVPQNFNIALPENKKILIHESIHCKQMHSIDLMLMETFKVINWINPLSFLLKKYTQLTHEFLADEATVKETKDVKKYAMLILHQSCPELSLQLTNQFNFSPVKKRIFMLQKRKTNRSMRWSYLSIIPVIAMLILTFSCQKTDTTVSPVDASQAKDKAAQLEIAEKALELDNKGEEIHVMVEDPPEFPGGQDAMMQFIYSNITYPAEAKDAGIDGICVISFVVEKDGSLSNVEVVRDIGGGCGAECERVVNSMPNWKPGKERGEAVKVEFNLPVRFKLQ